MIGSDEGIKLESTDVKVIGYVLVNLDGITIGLDVGPELGYLYGLFDGYNYGKLEGLLLG